MLWWEIARGVGPGSFFGIHLDPPPYLTLKDPRYPTHLTRVKLQVTRYQGSVRLTDCTYAHVERYLPEEQHRCIRIPGRACVERFVTCVRPHSSSAPAQHGLTTVMG